MKSSSAKRNPDIVIVGAGLSGGILAWYLKFQNPRLQVLVLEQNACISSNKTWCFHKSDISADEFKIIKPLLSNQWHGYDVSFQKFERALDTHYCAIRPENFQKKLVEILGADLNFNVKLRKICSDSVELEGGEVIQARLIVDARGRNPASPSDSGYQKFFGQQIEFENPHGLTRPILMDTRVSQDSGFRFMYVLPWSTKTALIEDTYYDDDSDLDIRKCQLAIHEFATSKGWQIKSVISEEHGKLPIPLHAPAPNSQKNLTIGVSAGFYHAVTGYSVPDAVRVAIRIAKIFDSHQTTLAELCRGALKTYRSERNSSWTFLCILNRMLFKAAKKEKRVRVFERFYQLPQKLIERFYAGNLTWFDKFRILSGKPPVPVLAAIAAIRSLPATTPAIAAEAIESNFEIMKSSKGFK